MQVVAFYLTGFSTLLYKKWYSEAKVLLCFPYVNKCILVLDMNIYP